MTRYAVIAITVIVLMVLPLVPFSPQPLHSTRPRVPAPPTAPIAPLVKSPVCPLPAPQCSASINWSGYAVTNATNSVTFVGATWKVPAIAGASGTSCPGTVQTWLDASFWVGIDGWSDAYVEQTGTSSDCVYGRVEYYPWYEFYPAATAPLPSSDKIYPGDTIYAYVNYTSRKFGIWIQDKTAGHAWYFSVYGTNPGALRNSAEWITEPAFGCITPDCSVGNFLALTDFTSVTFTGASATVACPTCAIPGTYTFPISSTAWGASRQWTLTTTVFYPIQPPNYGLGPFIRSIPTAPSNSGDFTVKWVSSGP